MRRSFSFQSDASPPVYITPSSEPEHEDGEPAQRTLDPRPYSLTRHDSNFTISSGSSVSGVGGAPSLSAFHDNNMYAPQTPSRPRAPQRPIAAAVGSGPGPGSGSGHEYDGANQYFTPAQHSSDTLSTQTPSPSPISQLRTPLINNTPARFADPQTPTLPHATPPTPAHRMGTLDNRSTDRVLNDPVGGHYTDNPYSRYSTTWDPQLSARQVQATAADAFVFSDDEDERTPRPTNAPVERGLLGGSEGGSLVMNEKAMPSDWLRKQTHSKKKTRWVIGLILALLLLAAAGGAAAGVLLSKKRGSTAAPSSSTNGGGDGGGGGGGGLTGSEDVAKNGELNKDSPEIKALLNNPKLHKVFHGIDYTPMNSQYPACLQNPPTQNNVTRDVAVMSLLTDKLRLYGTDCNQTELVLNAITALDISMTIWLGVWLDYNTTTNTRQLTHLYNILANYPASRFEGIAVGNEVLFREDLSEQQLFSTIADVRHNLSALSIDLPVSTSDLGSNWKASMIPYVDVLMANVHPFFAGVVVEKAANWTWNFFQTNDVVLTQGLTKPPRVMISEVGWPSAGGNDSGSVAGISEMNLFMEQFVCGSNSMNMEYFWFEGFDEPWKVVYDTPGKEWEDKWGLLDVNRNLKDGLVIPTCT